MSKIGGVIVSHGQVATELVAAAETVVGDISHIVAVSIGWHDDVEAAKNEIARAIKNVSQGSGVIVLTDMFGGTPTNISAMFLKEGEVEIVTGVNLPMVIKLASNSKEISISDLAREIEDQGKQAIYRTGALLEPQLKKSMLDGSVNVVNPLGLHARAAAELVRVAGKYRSRITLHRDDSNAFANAKSILSVLALAAAVGTVLRIQAEGEDEGDAFDAITKLFEDGFGEI